MTPETNPPQTERAGEISSNDLEYIELFTAHLRQTARLSSDGDDKQETKEHLDIAVMRGVQGLLGESTRQQISLSELVVLCEGLGAAQNESLFNSFKDEIRHNSIFQKQDIKFLCDFANEIRLSRSVIDGSEDEDEFADSLSRRIDSTFSLIDQIEDLSANKSELRLGILSIYTGATISSVRTDAETRLMEEVGKYVQ
ncbi:MAG TPA: hypothetical protein VMQ58_03310 [Candidatus Saccharimonadales bacterium]|jgi:hypothetical protein|nr:hypothetical protein [Candidatus Saccharimonadales bacterium]